MIHLQYWHHLIHLICAHLKRNQETIRAILAKKKHKETRICYISEQNANEQIKAE